MADWNFLDGVNVGRVVIVGMAAWTSLVVVGRASSRRPPCWSSSLVRQAITRAGRRSLSLIGLLMFGSTQSAATLRRVLPSTRPASAMSEPSRAWAGEPPPHVFPSPAQSAGPRVLGLIQSHRAIHPAVHGGSGVRELGGPLFVREGRGSQVRVVRDRVPRGGWRGDAAGTADGTSNGSPRMAGDKSSAASPKKARRDLATWEVRSGDSLWEIAEKTLKTKDPRRIARYWPKLHRHNREVIGANPNLLQPGQRLRLPPENR